MEYIPKEKFGEWDVQTFTDREKSLVSKISELETKVKQLEKKDNENRFTIIQSRIENIRLKEGAKEADRKLKEKISQLEKGIEEEHRKIGELEIELREEKDIHCTTTDELQQQQKDNKNL